MMLGDSLSTPLPVADAADASSAMPRASCDSEGRLSGKRPSSDESPTVLIFEDVLLPYSQTFVVEQAENLRRYRPVYVGLRRADGIHLPPQRTCVLNRGSRVGRLREVAYKLTGFAPGFLAELRLRRPALIHAHFGPSGCLAIPLSRALDVPLVVTFHGFDATMTDQALSRGSYPDRTFVAGRAKLRSGARKVIAVSEFIKRRLVAQGFDPAAVEVSYIGVDTQRFLPCVGGARKRNVLYVGRMVPKKGCEYLIRAMSAVNRTRPDVTLTLVGDGPSMLSLKRLASELRVRAEFLGAQPHDAVRAHMNSSTVLCAPSVTAENGDAEGLGMILLEAQACGTPVVGSRSGGMPEALIEGTTGLLAEEGDVDGLATNLSRILDDERFAARMGEAGRAHVCRNFDIRDRTARLELLYDQILNGEARGRSADFKSG